MEITTDIQPPAPAGGEDLAARLGEALRERGLRMTPQRLAVANLLAERREHVTAEGLHRQVCERMPGVSLPTVYATLDLLVELGLVRRLLGESGAVVYDPELTDHHHLICSSCGAITDIEARVGDDDLLAAARRRGFRPERSQVVISGLCPACR